MATAQAAVVTVCDGCEDHDAKWFCEDCHENLCNRCKEIHLKFKKTKNDTIIPIGQTKQGNKTKVVPVLCEVHRTKICDLYCFGCEKIICGQCLSESHMTHTFNSLESLIVSKISELENIEQNLKSKLSSCDQVLDGENIQHTQYASHIDQLEVEVKGQSDRIVKEFYKLRDKQLSELTSLRKEEEKHYEEKCNKIHDETTIIKKTVESVQKAKSSGNAATMIQVVKESTQSYRALEDPTMSNLSRPEFQHIADLQPQLFLQLQGRIKVWKTSEVVKKQKNIVHTSQAEAGVAPTGPEIDLQNVRVKAKIQIKGKYGVYRVIIPVDYNLMWVAVAPDRRLSLIDLEGNVIMSSPELGGEIYNAAAYGDDILVTCKLSRCVMKVNKHGDDVQEFSDLSPFFTNGLCVTRNQEILVCLASSRNFDSEFVSKVVRLDNQGKVMQEIQNNGQEPLFSAAVRVTSLPTGDVVVMDYMKKNRYRIVCVREDGSFKYTWNGKDEKSVDSNVMWLVGITNDGHKVYINDYKNNCIYLLDSDGKAEQIMLDKFGITKPLSIAIHRRTGGRVWIGCGSEICVLE